MKRIASLIACCALSAQAVAATPAPGILAKAGGDYDSRARDRARCHQIVADAPGDDLPLEPTPMATGAGGGLYVVAGAAIANLLFLGVEVSRAKARAEAFCLANLGYIIVPLTAEEAASYARLAAAEREAYERTFLSGDIALRLAPLLASKTPPLPPYGDRPGVQGGLEIDLASLAAEEKPIEAGGVAVRGRADRRRNAVLETRFEATNGRVTVSADPGTVFHQVDYRTQRSPLLRIQGATWCGEMRQDTAEPSGTQPAGGAREVYCLTSQADGYDLFHPSGFAWLAGPYRAGFVLPRVTQPIVMREQPAGDPMSVGVEIRVAEVKHGVVILEGKAVRGGKAVDLWRRRLAFGADGNAVLPLWSRRLVLTRSGEARVSAVLDDRGDGHGWREGD